jgi:NAD+ kinase
MPSISRAAIFAKEGLGEAVLEVEAIVRGAGVELVKDSKAELVVVVGGDGTILRALQRFLGTGVPVIGVNFGRVGFLASMGPEDMADGLRRAFAGELLIVELPTLQLELDGQGRLAVNDVVAASSTVGRMVELTWSVGGEELGTQPCDGIICATPSGSTAYNLSSGGPVLVWGLDAMAVTFVSPHSLQARPLVVPRGRDLEIRNDTRDVAASVIADGQKVGELGSAQRAIVRLGEQRSLLATLPEMTFFRRYRDTFAS